MTGAPFHATSVMRPEWGMNGRELLFLLSSPFLHTVVDGLTAFLFGATFLVALPARFISSQD